MNNQNLSNPIYKKLFPETYEKNVKLQAALASFIQRNKFSDGVESLDIEPEIHNEV